MEIGVEVASNQQDQFLHNEMKMIGNPDLIIKELKKFKEKELQVSIQGKQFLDQCIISLQKLIYANNSLFDIMNQMAMQNVEDNLEMLDKNNQQSIDLLEMKELNYSLEKWKEEAKKKRILVEK